MVLLPPEPMPAASFFSKLAKLRGADAEMCAEVKQAAVAVKRSNMAAAKQNAVPVAAALLDDFETEEDIFDAIGGVLQEVDQTKTEDSIKTICNKIMCLIHGDNLNKSGHANGGASLENGVKKLTLDAPVHLGALVEDQASKKESESIWLSKQDDSLKTVDTKRLEKAEAQLQKKLENLDNT